MASKTSSWSHAFARAKDTEAEGRAAFADVLDDPTSAFASRKTMREQKADLAGRNADAGGEDEEEEEEEEGAKAKAKAKRGCFRQPRGLSQLYRHLEENPGALLEASAAAPVPDPAPEADEGKAPQSNLGRQICRQWLKSHYLAHPKPCDGSCGRLHAAPVSVMTVYKDYSFKGLPKKDREKILAAMKAESAGDAGTPTSSPPR